MPNFWKKPAAWVVVALGAYWGTLFVLTHMPMPPSEHPTNVDKLAHFVAYLGLTLLLAAVAIGWWGFSLRLLMLVWLAVAGYGIGDELSQPWFGRSADIRDWIADISGGLAGVLLAGVVWSVYRRWRERRGLSGG